MVIIILITVIIFLNYKLVKARFFIFISIKMIKNHTLLTRFTSYCPLYYKMYHFHALFLVTYSHFVF